MKIGIVRNEKIFIDRPVGGALFDELVSGDFLQIEGRGEEVVPVGLTECVRFVAHQGACRRRSQMREGRQYLAGPRVFIDDIVDLTVGSSVDGVENAVPFSPSRVLDKCR